MSNEQRKIGVDEHKVLPSRLLRQKLKNGDHDLLAYEEVGLISEDALNWLLLFKEHNPEGYQSDPRYKRVLRREISENLNNAVKNGNIDQMGMGIGISENKQKTDYRKLNRFKSLLDKEGKVYQLSAEPNAGKTNLALLMAEFWKEKRGGSVASNMASVEEFKTINEFDGLKEWLRNDGDCLFIFDDASNHASGYSTDKNAVETKMRKLTNFIAKYQASIIFIGHTGKDIHADIRRKSLYIHKKNKKHLAMYKSFKNGRGVNQIIEINGIPKAIYDYDPYERTEWNWCIDSDEKDDETIKQEIRQKIDELSQNKTTIQRSDHLMEYDKTLAKKMMIEYAENVDNWRFKDSPHRLQKKII